MISYLKGTIIYNGPNWLILDISGIGYKVFSCNRQHITYNKGENKEFWIYHHIREDRQELYGFEKMEELQMFELLIDVNGVGPKMAMNIMSQISPEEIRQAIEKSDSAIFSSVTGVGKKIAMKIILELKSKLKAGEITNLGDFDQSSQELLEAMQSLGYKKQELIPLLAKIPHQLITVEEKVKWVLKNKR